MTIRTAVLCILLPGPTAIGAQAVSPEQTFDADYQNTVRPFLEKYCLDCHSGDEPAAQVGLGHYQSLADVSQAHTVWKMILDRVAAGEMPPADAGEMPSPAEVTAVTEWIQSLRDHEAARNAGDPGIVLVRRLSNAEYDHSIREITGQDLQPTREFPVDPTNESGFDNSGESLTMSPALLSRYLDAARDVADHLVFSPREIRFAPHPVVTATDRDKYCVKRIIEFYQAQPTDLTDYFLACRALHRAADHTGETISVSANQLAVIAEQFHVSPRYLSIVWDFLQEDDTWGPAAEAQQRFDTVAATPSDTAAERMSEELSRYIRDIRNQLAPQFDNLDIRGIHKGAQAFVLWKNRQYAAARRRFAPEALFSAGEELPDGASPELVLPEDDMQRQRALASMTSFCSVFPDAFYISERGRDYLNVPKEKQEKGRLLSAGFHSMMGYFRDDGPLYELILTDSERDALDQLWLELDCVADVPQRQYAGFLWFERTDSGYMRDPEFDFARPENKDAASEEMIARLAEVYLSKARKSSSDATALGAIEDYFAEMNARVRRVEQERQQAQPLHLSQLQEFAARAWRRPLTPQEGEEIAAFYRTLRHDAGQDHTTAMRDSVVSILTSPYFLYRMDLAAPHDSESPLSGNELAVRLSYFLWAAPPDAELLAAFGNGPLPPSQVVIEQADRLMDDDRLRGLATEFAAHWLDVRRFEEHNSVDRERFPEFDDELRRSMFEEPLRFFVDVVQQDRSLLDFVDSNHTFVNRPLAEHYGIDVSDNDHNNWWRVQDADRYGRGGLLPMSVFLTKNSPGLRTSPVKRGYWVVRQLLGERIPPPPPDVPELPADESRPGELTLPELLARHRDNKSCAGCHDRFDAMGLSFEGFGPVGERRSQDLAGRPIQNQVTFPDGSTGTGVAGLRDYIVQNRRQDFLEQFCRKLLAYALGRSLILTDEPLLQQMQEDLQANDQRVRCLISRIVTSRQFQNRRGRPTPTVGRRSPAERNLR